MGRSCLGPILVPKMVHFGSQNGSQNGPFWAPGPGFGGPGPGAGPKGPGGRRRAPFWLPKLLPKRPQKEAKNASKNDAILGRLWGFFGEAFGLHFNDESGPKRQREIGCIFEASLARLWRPRADAHPAKVPLPPVNPRSSGDDAEGGKAQINQRKGCQNGAKK
jgi:hypothetical protein